jgi:hypothetical protein
MDGWPASMRVFARRERPHPGAQLSLFETQDGWRYSLWVSNVPARLRLITPDGDLARAEPKRCVTESCTRREAGPRRPPPAENPATWPWVEAIAAAWVRITAVPHAP